MLPSAFTKLQAISVANYTAGAGVGAAAAAGAAGAAAGAGALGAASGVGAAAGAAAGADVAGAGGAASGAALSTITPLFMVWLQLVQPLVTTPSAETLPPQLLHPLDTGAGEPHPHDETGALHPQAGAGALQPQDGAGAGSLQPQETGAGAQLGAGAHAGAHVGAGVQQEGAGAQLDALPQPRPARNFANNPACASAAEATTTEQTTRLATKNRLIGTSLGKQFFNDQKGWATVG